MTDGSGNVLDTASPTLTFTNDSPSQTASAGYALSDMPEEARAISAKTDWPLRAKVEFTPTEGQAAAHLVLRGGDRDGSNSINVLDYSRLKVKWGLTGEEAAPVDINGDGVINILDYSIMKSNWFQVGATP